MQALLKLLCEPGLGSTAGARAERMSSRGDREHTCRVHLQHGPQSEPDALPQQRLPQHVQAHAVAKPRPSATGAPLFEALLRSCQLSLQSTFAGLLCNSRRQDSVLACLSCTTCAASWFCTIAPKIAWQEINLVSHCPLANPLSGSIVDDP